MESDTTHECPAPKCDRRVHKDRFACPHHWFALPIGYRMRIWSTFRVAPGSTEHANAMADAIEWYEAKGY